MFGQQKRGGLTETRDLDPASEADFRAFVQSEVPERVRRRLDPERLGDRADRMMRLANLRARFAHSPIASTAMKLFGLDRMHPLRNSLYLYQFHWGLAKTVGRYRR
jgi:hypothetical protein